MALGKPTKSERHREVRNSIGQPLTLRVYLRIFLRVGCAAINSAEDRVVVSTKLHILAFGRFGLRAIKATVCQVSIALIRTPNSKLNICDMPDTRFNEIGGGLLSSTPNLLCFYRRASYMDGAGEPSRLCYLILTLIPVTPRISTGMIFRLLSGGKQPALDGLLTTVQGELSTR